MMPKLTGDIIGALLQLGATEGKRRREDVVVTPKNPISKDLRLGGRGTRSIFINNFPVSHRLYSIYGPTFQVTPKQSRCITHAQPTYMKQEGEAIKARSGDASIWR